MTAEPIRWRTLAWVGDSLALPILLGALYPTVFALSNNWYSISSGKVLWLLAACVAVGLLLAAFAAAAAALARLTLTLAGTAAVDRWAPIARAVVAALACAAILFVLLDGTLQDALRSPIAVGAAFLLAVPAIAWLFIGGRQRYFSGLLAVLTLASAAGWLWSWAEVKLWAPASAKFLAEKDPFEQARFAHKPNIYLFIYDAYGNRDLYQKVFKFDNSAHYRALEERGFKVVHTFSNYFATWPTTLSTFIGSHHYYRMSEGVNDTKLGRSIMAGIARNPVLETVRSNGYRVQYVHGIDYFVNEQGTLDFLFPDEPVYAALRVYNSPLFNSLAGNKHIFAGRRGPSEQKEVLLSRLHGPPGAGAAPWFTFAHVSLPAHGPTDKSWLQLGDFEKQYVERTVSANEHMLQVMDAIRAKDPGAIIVVFGDHGAWRYRRVWSLDRDPNRSFERAGVSSETVTLDIFGAMIAFYSNGRCDDYVYSTMTPVNIMRTVFACLSGNRDLLEARPEDISIFGLGRRLWVAARNGRPLEQWELFERP